MIIKQAESPFCSDLSRRVNEKIFGTAGVGTIWLLLEYPYPWAKRAITDSNLSPKIKSYLGELTRRYPGIKTLLIRRDHKPKQLAAFICLTREKEPIILRYYLKDYDDLLDLDLPRLVHAEQFESASLISQPLFLVCTHGRHDKCCAKYGFETYKIMKELAPDTTWQSSHVGGDRFASNVVCFPHGLFYGHVGNTEVNAILKSFQENNVYLPRYRGRACYSKHAQVAEFFVRTESGIIQIDQLLLKELCQVKDAATWKAVFSSKSNQKNYEVTFISKRSEFKNILTCHDDKTKDVTQFELLDYFEQ